MSALSSPLIHSPISLLGVSFGPDVPLYPFQPRVRARIVQDDVTLSASIPGFQLLLSDVQEARSTGSPYRCARLSLESEESPVRRIPGMAGAAVLGC